ncbi:MAG: alanine racemase [Actinomycetia bacterium]|nr:alanine racemase [Actinomycetes bacterium]
MHRSQITIDLRAVRHNVRRLRLAAAGAELWAVVKASGYGHGAVDVARAALEEGATALCVATAAEGSVLRERFRDARILILAGADDETIDAARAQGFEVAVSALPIPEGVPVHLKVDTGMGRWGMSIEDAAGVAAGQVVGVMTHLATADERDGRFASEQLGRFREVAARFPGATCHAANSAATLRLAESRFDAVRCGLALYGLSPFHDDPRGHGLEPVLSWRSLVSVEKVLEPHESTGYGRRFVAQERTRIGLVPVGYADGFPRALSGAEVLVGGKAARVLGAVSMDSFAVSLPTGAGAGSGVTLIGDGLLAEAHAQRLETITYELVCGISTSPTRCCREVIDG